MNAANIQQLNCDQTYKIQTQIFDIAILPNRHTHVFIPQHVEEYFCFNTHCANILEAKEMSKYALGGKTKLFLTACSFSMLHMAEICQCSYSSFCSVSCSLKWKHTVIYAKTQNSKR